MSFMRGLRAIGAFMCLALLLAAPLRADEAADRAALNAALGVGDLLGVMREEGQIYGRQIGTEFLPDGGGADWQGVVGRIYDLEKMRASVGQGMAKALPASAVKPLLTFFSSERGHRIVAAELAARRAFLDPAAEEAAREHVRNLPDAQEARLDLVRAYVEANDLVEYNVTGGLNSNLRFYKGLVDGGAYDMSEEEILADVWGQAEETRADTEEWLYAYLMMAYAPLEDGDIEAYVALSKTDAGRALNRALFAGFDGMYGDLSYAMGLAVAQQAKGEDL
ncbi:DUF2059 domain-containing protein [Rhodalgimonas zhirmunskyi]|uniref:DUF2059 domain-containing protein n=1 Tax=Rhodalgimonas zhirmunskyi TaxID=2964767 RepID=A0AAJ1U836_9RHOB|nr:DUF2059 domain-containing protein [Rhodoalgimonas zhirmunskyi]MDQ2093048.1 DUF2059 domain-containing protein [Rhodoalgimonas zhirmunskyi]